IKASVLLPTADRRLERYQLSAPKSFPDRITKPLNRVALAAAHMVADPYAEVDPWLGVAVDWDRTMAYRDYL
ncbi:DUF993 family protein, partial [Streptococcus pneumoniae]|uniref:DUF993 family protein n=1 Tax=Streptococcus pneumoniae TaxID=1313 RepID=UPI001954EEC1